MDKIILNISLITFGIFIALFGLLSLYITFFETALGVKVFHLLHFILVVLGFIIAYFGYKKYKHIFKVNK